MSSMLPHSPSNNKISVCNGISGLFEFVLGVAGHLPVLRRERFQLTKVDGRAEQNTGNS